MYIPYRKAYLTGMNPLSFITFFTVGELATMTVLAVTYRGAMPLWHELVSARAVMFWLMLGGFVWVIGDLFQQYATKYVGISRGIPLSNTNQLWGLLWGILVFHELRGASQTVYAASRRRIDPHGPGRSRDRAVLGNRTRALLLAGRRRPRRPALRRRRRIRPRRHGRPTRKSWKANRDAGPIAELLDWLLILGTTGLFAVPRAPWQDSRTSDISLGWASALTVAMLALLATCGIALWRTTRFRVSRASDRPTAHSRRSRRVC